MQQPTTSLYTKYNSLEHFRRADHKCNKYWIQQENSAYSYSNINNNMGTDLQIQSKVMQQPACKCTVSLTIHNTKSNQWSQHVINSHALAFAMRKGCFCSIFKRRQQQGHVFYKEKNLGKNLPLSFSFLLQALRALRAFFLFFSSFFDRETALKNYRPLSLLIPRLITKSHDVSSSFCC